MSYASSIFSFDVTVQNLIPQPLGTNDGTTPTAQGVQVFFNSGPTVTSGTGAISVANADGHSTFTSANQPYFQYSGIALGADGILTQNETSGAKTWQLSVAPTVTTFEFVVYVSTAIQHPQGYVQMSEDSNFVSAGNSHTLTASVRTSVGNANGSAAPIAWASSDNNIATVDASGHVSAVAPGLVTITATSDTLVGRTSLRICPNMSTVGSAYVASGSAASLVCLEGGASADAEYVAVAYNGTTSGNPTYTFLGTGIQTALGPPTPNVAPAAFRIALAKLRGSDARMLSMASKVGAGLQQRMRTNVPAFSSLTRRSFANAHRTATGGASRSITPGVVPSVGDPMTLDVQFDCLGTPDNRVGIVRSVSARAIVVEDAGNPSGGFTTAQFDSIGLEFDTVAYNVDSTNFGNPTDVDSNDRTVLFFTSAVNALGAPETSDEYGGIFSTKDTYPRDPSGCTTSNEGEILYMAVPDPAGAVNDARSVDSVRKYVTPYLTHHFEHLINAFRRSAAGAPFEQFFLDEGLADEATELAFYRTSAGLAPRTNIQLSDLTTGPNSAQRTETFLQYLSPNFARLADWLVRPDTTVGPDEGAARGAFWAFLRYASDRVNGSDPAFWRSLVNTNQVGLANLQTAIGGSDPFIWTRDFSTSLYTDDAVVGVGPVFLDPTFSYRSLFSAGGYPLLVRPISNNSTFSIQLSHGGATYLRFGVATGTFAKLATTEAGGVPTGTSSVTFIRTK